MFNIGGQNLVGKVKTGPQSKPKPQPVPLPPIQDHPTLKLRPPNVKDSPKQGTRLTRTGTRPKNKNNQVITNQEKITKYTIEVKELENVKDADKNAEMKKTSEEKNKETEKTYPRKFTKVLTKYSDKKVKIPLANINPDSFNLKNFLELKKRERDSKIGQNLGTTVKPIANRIVEMCPSPNSNYSMGTKDEVLRQVTTVTRSIAAEQQLEIMGSNKYEPEDAIGPI